jgi:peptide deformylase
MATCRVVQYTENSIHQRSNEIPLEAITSGKLRGLIKNMRDTMFKENGVGIAAPQIGDNRRAIIVETKHGPLVVLNPVLHGRSILQETQDEGCLSVKGIFGTVRRHRALSVTGIDEQGRPIKLQARGLLARIFQHEVDHLNGILIIDRMKKVTQGAFDLTAWKRSA